MSDDYKQGLLERIKTFCLRVNGKDGEAKKVEYLITTAKVVHDTYDVDDMDEKILEWMTERIYDIDIEFEKGYDNWNFSDPNLVFDIQNKCILFEVGDDGDGTSLDIKWELSHTPSLWLNEKY